ANRLLGGWYLLDTWCRPITTLLQREDARRTVPDRAGLTAAVAVLAEHRDELDWIVGLLKVVDGDRLVVLHRESRQGYLLTTSGVSDNFQLHTLLAGVLIGEPATGLIPGERPDPRWFAAATDAEVDPEA